MALSEIRTQIYLERAQHTALKKEAERRSVSMAQLVREAVEAQLRGDLSYPHRPGTGGGSTVAEPVATQGRSDAMAGDLLVQALVELTGESPGEAIERAVGERLERLRKERAGERLADRLDRIALRCAALPRLDQRSEDEILGYGPDGLLH